MNRSRFIAFSARLLLTSMAGCSSIDDFAIADSDGQLSTREVETALNTAFCSNGDSDRDGRISFVECRDLPSDYPRAHFEARDGDGDGGISREELEQFVDRTGTFDSLIGRFARNGDRYFDRREAATFNVDLLASEGAIRLRNSTG